MRQLSFETFVSDIMTLAVGVELIKMLSQHTPATVVEVLMFAIARDGDTSRFCN